MKIYSTNILSVIHLDNLSIFYLIHMDFASGAIFHTNAPIDIDVVGLGYFDANNSLQSIDAPRLSAVVDREAYKIQYSDNTYEFRAIFEQGIVGSPVDVYIGFYNTNEFQVNGVEPGQPFSNYEDLILAYSGFVDSHGHSTNVEEGEVSAILECSSPFASLDLVKPFYSSRDGMRQVNPLDSSFDDVYQGSKEINLVWGKK